MENINLLEKFDVALFNDGEKLDINTSKEINSLKDILQSLNYTARKKLSCSVNYSIEVCKNNFDMECYNKETYLLFIRYSFSVNCQQTKIYATMIDLERKDLAEIGIVDL